jgi:predicted N-acetyltransferase YhbS
MPLVRADTAILNRILDDSHDIWSDGLTREAYGRYNAAQLRTPWGATHLCRIALVDEAGRLLSSAKRYHLRATLDGREIDIIGIAAVFTPPEVRNRGYAQQLVRQIMDEAARDGAELALLFSEIDRGFYEALGFVAIPRRELLVRVKEGLGAPMVLVRSAEERDIPAVTALATRMTAGHRFALIPTEDAIRFSLTKKRLLAGSLPSGALAVEFYVVEEGAGAVAFAILTATRDDVVLEMCGDRDPTGARVGALLQVLRARTPGEPATKMTGFLPAGWLPPQMAIERAAFVRDVMMVRPLVPGVLREPLHEEHVLFWHGDLF